MSSGLEDDPVGFARRGVRARGAAALPRPGASRACSSQHPHPSLCQQRRLGPVRAAHPAREGGGASSGHGRARAQASAQDTRIQELESELGQKDSELQTARSAGVRGRSEKEFFALRESVNRKDKELLTSRASSTRASRKCSSCASAKPRSTSRLLRPRPSSPRRTASSRPPPPAWTRPPRTSARRSRPSPRPKRRPARRARSWGPCSQSSSSSSGARPGPSGAGGRARPEQPERLARGRKRAPAPAHLRARARLLQARVQARQAYQRVKDHEKARDKLKKALGIASQLLDEPASPETTRTARQQSEASTSLGLNGDPFTASAVEPRPVHGERSRAATRSRRAQSSRDPFTASCTPPPVHGERSRAATRSRRARTPPPFTASAVEPRSPTRPASSRSSYPASSGEALHA